MVRRDSIVGMGTRHGLDVPGIESRWGRHFPHPSRPALGLHSLLYNGYRVPFPVVKRPGRGVNHPPQSSAEVKERVELYLYYPSGPSWPVLGKTLPLSFIYLICKSVEKCRRKFRWQFPGEKFPSKQTEL
jgi:hypothetical protein